MTKHAERRAEMLAADLLDAYLEERLHGRLAAADALLARCPGQERERLDEAIQGIESYLKFFHATYVRTSVLEKTLQRLEAVKRKKMWMNEMQGRVAKLWELDPSNPIGGLANLMKVDMSGDVALAASNMLVSATGQPAIFNRGGNVGSARDRRFVDRAWRRAMEHNIIRESQEVLDQAMITEAPVDLGHIAARLFLFVQEVALEATEGCLLTDGEVGSILINRNIPSRQRRRYTLAHEIGHFVMHRKIRIFRDTERELSNEHSSLTEMEANMFASMLLMPPSLLKPNFGMERPSLDQAIELAKRFDVSIEPALRRVVGQSHWRCALIVSNEGLIQRSVLSPEFEGYIPQGQPPHQGTIARMLLDKDGQNEGTAVLPAEAWIDQPLIEAGTEVREESRRSSSGYVYSLITILDPV